MCKNAKQMPSREFLQEYFSYDPVTGDLSWKKAIKCASKCVVGTPLRQVDRKGYLTVGLQGKNWAIHRIVYAMFYGDPGELVVDHIDRDKLNNRISNLRAVTQRDNKLNTARKALVFQFKNGKYYSRIKVAGTPLHLGCFLTAEEADAAYWRAKEVVERHKVTSAYELNSILIAMGAKRKSWIKPQDSETILKAFGV